jgi:myo-inositol-1(or 4)-monophosphatase
MNHQELPSLEKEVVRICQTVGGFIRQEAHAFDRSRIEFKQSFNNLVSYVDKEAEIQLIRELKKFFRKRLPGRRRHPQLR